MRGVLDFRIHVFSMGVVAQLERTFPIEVVVIAVDVVVNGGAPEGKDGIGRGKVSSTTAVLLRTIGTCVDAGADEETNGRSEPVLNPFISGGAFSVDCCMAAGVSVVLVRVLAMAVDYISDGTV